jgi:hypothetical protein
MGKFNRFEPLKGYDGSGFKQVAKVKDYKRLSRTGSDLIGAGLCSAMTMHWLQSGTQPTTFNDYAELALSQADYEKLSGEAQSITSGSGVSYFGVLDTGTGNLFLAISSHSEPRSAAATLWQRGRYQHD